MFSIFESEERGCTSHHWEEKRKLEDYRIRSDTFSDSSYAIFQKIKEECQHEDCNTVQYTWKRINFVSDSVDSGANRRFRKKLEEVLEYPYV
jgi:hypothetical protein